VGTLKQQNGITVFWRSFDFYKSLLEINDSFEKARW
jgi:hypothetical protein